MVFARGPPDHFLDSQEMVHGRSGFDRVVTTAAAIRAATPPNHAGSGRGHVESPGRVRSAGVNHRDTETPRGGRMRRAKYRAGDGCVVEVADGSLVYDLVADPEEARLICEILNRGIGPEWDAVEPVLRRWKMSARKKPAPDQPMRET